MESINSVTKSGQEGLQIAVTSEAFPELRQEQRHQLHSAIIVAFYNRGKLFRGYMADLCTGGAQIVLPSGIPDLSIGRKMECYLLNGHGSSKCRGAIRWMQRDGAMLRWGISFIELPVWEDDPFLKSIDEARRFCKPGSYSPYKRFEARQEAA